MRQQFLHLSMLIGLTVASSLIAKPVFASACAAAPNTWYRAERQPSNDERTIITEFSSLSGQFGSWSARDPILFMDESSVPISGRVLASDTWEFSFLLSQESASQLVSFVFEADSVWEFSSFDANVVGESPTYSEYQTSLYKEVVVPGSIQLPEAIAEAFGNSQVAGRLIFQGYGDACPIGSNFSNWVLQILDPSDSDSAAITGAGQL